MTADPTLATLRERHYRYVSDNPMLPKPYCPACLQDWDPDGCDAERFRQALDAALADAHQWKSVNRRNILALDAALGERDVLVAALERIHLQAPGHGDCSPCFVLDALARVATEGSET